MRIRQKKEEAPKTRRRVRETILPSIADTYEGFSSKEDKDYYYVFLPAGNSSEFDKMESLIIASEIPCEVSEAPSGWRCYRVKREYEDRLIPMKPDSGKWQSNFGLPAGYTYGMWKKRERVWRMMTTCDMAYLYKKWRTVYADKRVRNKEPVTLRKRVRKHD